jgi:seryl-tRNA synthetase
MLYIPYVRENKEAVIKGLQKKRFPNADQAIERLLDLDKQRSSLQTDGDMTRAFLKGAQKAIGEMMKTGNHSEAQEYKAGVAEAKQKEKEQAGRYQAVIKEFENLILTIPNVPHASVPEGPHRRRQRGGAPARPGAPNCRPGRCRTGN